MLNCLFETRNIYLYTLSIDKKNDKAIIEMRKSTSVIDEDFDAIYVRAQYDNVTIPISIYEEKVINVDDNFYTLWLFDKDYNKAVDTFRWYFETCRNIINLSDNKKTPSDISKLNYLNKALDLLENNLFGFNITDRKGLPK